MAFVRSQFLYALAAASLAFAAVAYQVPHKADASERAYMAGRAGDGTGAALIYSNDIARDPDAFINYLRRGLTFVQMKEYEKALVDFNEAIRLSPNTMTAEMLGDRVWNSELPETHLWTLDLQAHVVRAEVLEILNRHAEALVDLDYAVASNAGNLALRHHRGVIRTLTGSYDDALADFDFVLSHQFNLDSVFARGLAKYLKEDWSGAVTDFASANQRAPNNSKYTEWLGKAQFRQDRAMNGNFEMPAGTASAPAQEPPKAQLKGAKEA